MNNAIRAYEFMLKIKQNGFSLSREEDPQLYASYNELMDELQAFARLENCQFYRSRKYPVIHLIPNNKSRYAFTDSALANEMGVKDVAHSLLSDFAILTLIQAFFNPQAVEFKVRKNISLMEWTELITKELDRLVELASSEEVMRQHGYDLKALANQWAAKPNTKDEEDKTIKESETKQGFLRKIGAYLIKQSLLIAEKQEKDDEEDEFLPIYYYPTPRFEDLSEHLLNKQKTLKFLDQLQPLED